MLIGVCCMVSGVWWLVRSVHVGCTERCPVNGLYPVMSDVSDCSQVTGRRGSVSLVWREVSAVC